jgi:hypothetical protein
MKIHKKVLIKKLKQIKFALLQYTTNRLTIMKMVDDLIIEIEGKE